MKTILLLLLVSFNCFSQIINNLEIKNSIILDAQNASTALVLDAQKRLISSTVTSAELAYLSGVTSSIQTQIGNKANDNEVVKLTGDQSISGKKTFTQYEAVSTTLASKPCPTMTTAQRNLLTPSAGDCVYNSTTNEQNTYNGSQWMRYGRNVAIIYRQNSGQATSGNTIMLYNLQTLDTHSAYNTSTGVFTAPEAGVYFVTASWLTGNVTWASGARSIITIKVNGTNFNEGIFRAYTTTSTSVQAKVSGLVSLALNDTVSIEKNATGDPASSASADANHLSIYKVGN
jgi:hypothetical protein